MKKTTSICFLIVSIFVFSFAASAQKTDSSAKKLFRPNIIKLNLSSFLLYSPNFLVTYERVVAPYKTFSVEAGYVEFPTLIGSVSDSFDLIGSAKKSGFKIDADFRFYFLKENKYEAPHGLYVGPYMAYYYFRNERSVSFEDTSFAKGTANFVTTLQSPQIGVELGYQFSLLKDRMTVDLLMIGPALSLYSAKLDLDGDFDINEENAYLNDLLKLLIDNFPVLNTLVQNKEVSTNGVANLLSVGYRYSIQVGYRF